MSIQLLAMMKSKLMKKKETVVQPEELQIVQPQPPLATLTSHVSSDQFNNCRQIPQQRQLMQQQHGQKSQLHPQTAFKVQKKDKSIMQDDNVSKKWELKDGEIGSTGQEKVEIEKSASNKEEQSQIQSEAIPIDKSQEGILQEEKMNLRENMNEIDHLSSQQVQFAQKKALITDNCSDQILPTAAVEVAGSSQIEPSAQLPSKQIVQQIGNKRGDLGQEQGQKSVKMNAMLERMRLMRQASQLKSNTVSATHPTMEKADPSAPQMEIMQPDVREVDLGQQHQGSDIVEEKTSKRYQKMQKIYLKQIEIIQKAAYQLKLAIEQKGYAMDIIHSNVSSLPELAKKLSSLLGHVN